jgi:hydrogenase maturation protease
VRDRVLVACVGNVLRGDDGFGFAVANRLGDSGELPGGVDLIETGIGGMGIVQQLLDGYRLLIIVDAVERGARPGTVFVLEPHVPDPHALTLDEWRTAFSNLHLAEPSRVLLLARAAGALPERVLIVGCQPADCERIGEGLSRPVAAAVDIATRRVCELLEDAVPARAPRDGRPA